MHDALASGSAKTPIEVERQSLLLELRKAPPLPPIDTTKMAKLASD
jgi:hypothetical protein